MADRSDTDNPAPVPQRNRVPSTRDLPGRTPCPSCGRVTATVGHGACAECWQAKTPDGEPTIRPGEPKTLPLLGPIGEVPDWIWLALASAVTGFVAGVVYLF